MKRFSRLLLSAVITAAILIPGHAAGSDGLTHREDFTMNAVGGGDLRDYVSEVVTEDDPWATSMRTLGTFHNLMHLMMTEMARYDAVHMTGAHRVPDFGARISGGDWTDYREAMEQAGDESSWREVVQVTEIMHDRVHHAMYKAVVHDHQSRDRDVDLSRYMRRDVPHPSEQTIPPEGTLTLPFISEDAFRELVWHTDFEQQHLYSSMQTMMVFANVLSDLMTQWANHGNAEKFDACRPPVFQGRIDGAQWAAYAARVSDCDQQSWRQLVQVTGLMHDRIHHMMHVMADHVAREHER